MVTTRLTDRQFFLECADSSIPALASLPALAEAGVNIRMIDQGSSEMNIIVGVENKDFDQRLHAGKYCETASAVCSAVYGIQRPAGTLQYH